MKTIAALILVALTVASVAHADDGLSTAWPVHAQAALATASDGPPSNGMTLLYPGMVMTAVGMGTSIYGTYLAGHSSNLGLSYGLFISGSTVAITGSVMSFVAMLQSIRYVNWMNKHPVLKGLALSPTSVGYHASF
jgi:hypothetical protein